MRQRIRACPTSSAKVNSSTRYRERTLIGIIFFQAELLGICFPPNWPGSVGFCPKLLFNIHLVFMSAYWVRQQLLRPNSEIDFFRIHVRSRTEKV
jgi:hypothetical protein